MFRVVVAGSRSFADFELMTAKLDRILSRKSDVVIVSGCARGADQLGERYAELRGYPVERYPAQWEIYGKAAGYRRNEEMAAVANAVVLFWDGQSRGTAHMRRLADRLQLPLRVVSF